MIIKRTIPGAKRPSSFHDEEFEVLGYLYRNREFSIWTTVIQDETRIVFIRQPLEALRRKKLIEKDSERNIAFSGWNITELGEKMWLEYCNELKEAVNGPSDPS